VLTVGFVPLVPMLLTIKDGQGVPSDIDGAVRVIILSGAADGQEVPQGARTVDLHFGQYAMVMRQKNSEEELHLPGRWRLQQEARKQRERTASC